MSEESKAGPLSIPVPTQPPSLTRTLRRGRLGARGAFGLSWAFRSLAIDLTRLGLHLASQETERISPPDSQDFFWPYSF